MDRSCGKATISSSIRRNGFRRSNQVPAAENLLINQFKQILQLGLGPALHLLTQVFF